MNTAIRFLVVIIVGFTVLSGTLEVYRIINTKLIIEEDIRTMALDALEISLLDNYYKEGIHVLDETKLRNTFNDLMREKYGLNNSWIPRNTEAMFSQFEIKLNCMNGTYSLNNGMGIYAQRRVPFIEVKGKTSIKPMVLNVVDRIDVNFDVTVTTENLY